MLSRPFPFQGPDPPGGGPALGVSPSENCATKSWGLDRVFHACKLLAMKSPHVSPNLDDPYFNEIDPICGDWLGRLYPGARIDRRSIVDLAARDVRGSGRRHFFAGIGGWELACDLAGWTGDIWTGSCPCQPFSAAGKRKGTGDERHLWPEFRRLIAECRPTVVVGEQVSSPLGRDWLAGVRADLEDLGYAVGAADLCAAGVGAPHLRQRLYWVAYAPREQHDGGGDAGTGGRSESADRRGPGGLADPDQQRRAGLDPLLRAETGGRHEADLPQVTGGGWAGWGDTWLQCLDGKARRVEPGIFPLAHGVPGRVGRLRAYGNAIVPPLAAVFLRAVLDLVGGGMKSSFTQEGM